MNIPGYDAWRLQGPDEDRHEIGTEDGQTCGRFWELDEDAPRGAKPSPCQGTMTETPEGGPCCDTCGAFGG